MTFVSYAQNFEDVLLWRALGHIKDGRYVDIGAQDPVVDSVSLAFYNAGWRGIHVEATPAYAAKLRAARPDETVIQAAVSDEPGPMVFYEIPGTGLSTGDQEIAANHSASGFESQAVVVPSIRLDQLLAMEDRDIHWMKIDVEGMEGAVLRSWGDNSRRPWVLVIEATFPGSQEPTHLEWISEVSRRGYEEVYFDGLSRYFVHEDQKALARHFSVPPNVFDRFSVSRNHFTSTEVARQFEAAAKEHEAQLVAVKDEHEARIATIEREARQKIEAALDTADAAVSDSNRLRSDLSNAVEGMLSAQRHHRRTIARLWGDRRASEKALRQERRDVVARLEAEIGQLIDNARSSPDVQ